VLPGGGGGAASTLRGGGSGPPLPGPAGSLHPTAGQAHAATAGSTRQSSGSGAAGLDAKLEALAALCELASTVTAVDHPLCLDCAAQLKEEVQRQLEELETEIAAYSDALTRLQGEAPQELSTVWCGLVKCAARAACMRGERAAARWQRGVAKQCKGGSAWLGGRPGRDVSVQLLIHTHTCMHVARVPRRLCLRLRWLVCGPTRQRQSGRRPAPSRTWRL
jgi:hypothetical protein